jgi:hypothetical protein
LLRYRCSYFLTATAKKTKKTTLIHSITE